MQGTRNYRRKFKSVSQRGLSNPADDGIIAAENELYVENEVVWGDNSFALPDYVYENCIGENGCALACIADATVLQLEKMGIELPSGASAPPSGVCPQLPTRVLAPLDTDRTLQPTNWIAAESDMQWVKPHKQHPLVFSSFQTLHDWTQCPTRYPPAKHPSCESSLTSSYRAAPLAPA